MTEESQLKNNITHDSVPPIRESKQADHAKKII